MVSIGGKGEYYRMCCCGSCQFAVEDVEMILVANKIDMEESRSVKTSKGKKVFSSFRSYITSMLSVMVLA